MVHAPGPEAPLRQREALAPGTQQVQQRNARVAKHDLAVPFGRVVLHDRDVAHDMDAGRIQRHQHHAVSVVARVVRRAFIAAHHDQELAVGVRGAGDEPFAPVDGQFAAFAPHRRLQVRRVRRSHVRLRHRERRANLAFEQRPQPFFLLVRRGIALQQFHVAAVRRAAVEHLRRPIETSHRFGQRCVVEIGQARSGVVCAQRRQAQVPQALRFRERLQVFEERRRHALRRAAMPRAVVRQHVALEKGLQLRELGARGR
jgi:hypothetical protein